MRQSFLVSITILSALFVSHAEALYPPIMNGTVSAHILKTKPTATLSIPSTKEVVLMKVELSPSQQQTLLANLSAPSSPAENTGLPTKFDMGMNNVPVLDQGMHGSCVTFAVTAAIDALLQKGDYVSQLCNLAVGKYLEENGYFPSGWNGSSGLVVINQIQSLGIINKTKQTKNTCGGLSRYPTKDEYNTGKPMSLNEFKAMSEQVGAYGLYSESILSFLQRFGLDPNYNYDPNKVLNEVKKTISTPERAATPRKEGYRFRITFGTLVPTNHCHAGLCAKYKANSDTWALTDAMKNDPNPTIAGHEMIITGYDDNAIAIDNKGVKHKGILILRNSWGDDVGDRGTFYMTYDYFKEFVIDITKVVLPTKAS